MHFLRLVLAHHRVGTRSPRNEELVAELVAIGRSLGREPATLAEAIGLLALPSRTDAAT